MPPQSGCFCKLSLLFAKCTWCFGNNTTTYYQIFWIPDIYAVDVSLDLVLGSRLSSGWTHRNFSQFLNNLLSIYIALLNHPTHLCLASAVPAIIVEEKKRYITKFWFRISCLLEPPSSLKVTGLNYLTDCSKTIAKLNLQYFFPDIFGQ